MFCPNCGKELDDRAVLCPGCGRIINESGFTPAVKSGARPDDAPSAGFAVLCFFFPILGLILFLVWNNDYPQRAKSCGKGALISVIVGVAVGVITFIILLAVLPYIVYAAYPYAYCII